VERNGPIDVHVEGEWEAWGKPQPRRKRQDLINKGGAAEGEAAAEQGRREEWIVKDRKHDGREKILGGISKPRISIQGPKQMKTGRKNPRRKRGSLRGV